MKLFFLVLVSFFFLINFNGASSAPIKIHRPTFKVEHAKSFESLDFLFKTDWKHSADYSKLSQQSLRYGPKAVPVLLQVMKKKSYPINNRWIAMFSLTKLMGTKTAPVLAKFTSHPDWMMRLGALKCLLFLKQTKYSSIYIKLLSDPSLVVRQQALTNVNILNIREAAPTINQLLDKKSDDEILGMKGSASIIDLAVLTLGKLGQKDSIKPLTKMLQKESYKRHAYAIDYSLERITGRSSPKGDWNSKIAFWNANTKI